MIIKGLDGREYKVNLSKHKYRKNCSGLHIKARELIHILFPCFTPLEEVRCYGSKSLGKTDLFLDFLILELDLAIEVHGKQHFKYTPYFHKSKLDFLKQKRRDRDKSEWCRINNFTLKILKEGDDWQKALTTN